MIRPCFRIAAAAPRARARGAPGRARQPEREARVDFDRGFSKTLAVKAGQRLDIEHSQGALRVSSHTLPEIRIEARIPVSSSGTHGAQSFGEAIVIAVEDTESPW